MFKSIVNKVFGTRHEREMKKMRPMLDRIAQLEAEFTELDDDSLKAKTGEFRERYDNGESLDDLLPEAFAVCRAASVRALGMRHFDVQMIGGIVMHRGGIAEMRTGEGKTLTATLPLYLHGLSGKGAHLVTVNDYLARRDAEWMGELYGWLGLSTGVIVPNLSEVERREAYGCDITYGTNNEYGFDYLRDNMKYSLSRKVQRGLNFAIVDEVDSILIDEARTPLIISGPVEQSVEMYYRINDVVTKLKRDEDYIVDEEHRSSTLTEEGIDKVELLMGIDNLFDAVNIETVHHVTKALEAHTLYQRDEKYIVQDNKIVIVDDFTGRLMPGRRWSDGLHQAIEAKEGVKIENESVTLATVTFQNFFRMYNTLAGMTGTADTEAEEFHDIYKLSVTVIPTNKPIQRIDQPDVIYRTEREKFAAIVDQILECHEKGQPVLVGTVSVDKSEVISKVLRRKKIAHNVLNAKMHEQEAGIVAQAGRRQAIMIATNMAGRGTDIVLGGNPESMALAAVGGEESSPDYPEALARFQEICARERQMVLDAGGLFILGTERHDSRRIDNQLRGRAGRQGDPGESRFFLSLEDELMRRFGAEKLQGILQRLGMEDGVPIEAPMVSKSIENAQKRVEGRNFDIRKNLLEYDDVMDLQRKTVYGLRDRILAGEEMRAVILDVLDEALASTVEMYANPAVRADEWDMDGLVKALRDTFNVQDVDADALPRESQALAAMLWTRVEADLETRIAAMDREAEAYNARYAEDAEFERKTGEEIFFEYARVIYLQQLDRRYRDHLQAMRNLRESVSLHGYAQKDPKRIYKQEGFDLFTVFRTDVNATVAASMLRLEPATEASLEEAQQMRQRMQQEPKKMTFSGGGSESPRASNPQANVPAGFRVNETGTARRVVPKIGRNEPCWCGSGKKYKQCHMKSDSLGDTAPPPDPHSAERQEKDAPASPVQAPPAEPRVEEGAAAERQAKDSSGAKKKPDGGKKQGVSVI